MSGNGGGGNFNDREKPKDVRQSNIVAAKGTRLHR